MEPLQSAARESLRKDAAENRTKLLEAASVIFTRQGTDAPLEAIASEAGVGIATLYRRFPTREALLAAVIEEELDLYLTAVDAALAASDPWVGFSAFVEAMFLLQSNHPGLCHAPFVDLPGAERLEQGRERMQAAIEELMARAKDAGRVRPEVTTADLMLLAWGNTGVIANSGAHNKDSVQRYLQIVLAAFKA